MKTPHKHADVIKAWADGAEIQAKSDNVWLDCRNPEWWPNAEYRIKPEPKPDIVTFGFIPNWTSLESQTSSTWWFDLAVRHACTRERLNLSLTFDGETGKLKSAEVL